MKLYIEGLAPNVRRVQMYLAEKQLKLSLSVVDLQRSEQKSKEFLSKNPMGQLPVLELEDGICISESITICRYLDELNPKATLFGDSSLQRAKIDMWQRRVEFGLFVPAVEYGHHTSPFFSDTQIQIPEWAIESKVRLLQTWEILNDALSDQNIICEDGFSIVDITAFVATEVALLLGIPIPKEYENLERWYHEIKKRPCAEAICY